MVNWSLVDKSKIHVEGDGDEFTAMWDGEDAGELRLFEDDQGRMWLNFVDVEEAFQRRGIGLAMLEHAVEIHDILYVASGMQIHDETSPEDTRHLSTEGVALVNSAIRNNILQKAWCFNPAAEYDHDND